jgi:hypothetical protein
MLVLNHSKQSAPLSLPKLKGVRVAEAGGGSKGLLTFTLIDSDHKDLFYRLCIDIVEFSSSAVSESDLINRAMSRTWRWHHLLRGGGDERLSPEQQKGLMGELLVLNRHLIPALGYGRAVASWHGPLGASRDFELGTVAIESKATQSAASGKITINSGEQLETDATSNLFLYVTHLERDALNDASSTNLTEFAAEIRGAISNSEPSALLHFESMLTAAGFNWKHDYSDIKWAVRSNSIYLVEDGFPKIDGRMIVTGVSKISYQISLSACARFKVEEASFITRLANSA